MCAQQIYCVLSAIRERKKSFVFTDGSTVPLDPRVGELKGLKWLPL